MSIDPMPALISTTLHNLCTCASIKKSSAPSERGCPRSCVLCCVRVLQCASLFVSLFALLFASLCASLFASLAASRFASLADSLFGSISFYRFLPGPAWRPLLWTSRVAQVVPRRRVVFHNFQFAGAVKRLVLHQAHIRPIDPM